MASKNSDDIFWIGGATNWGSCPTPGLRALKVASDGTAQLGPAEPAGGNPTFGALLPDGNLVVVNEIKDGQVSLYSLSREQATLFNSASTDSAAPTHLASTPDGSTVVVANYSGGALTVHAVRPLCINSPSLKVQYHGSGPHPRQDAPHPHQVVVSEDGGSVLVPDLGMDVVHVHRIEDLLNSDSRHRDMKLEAGSGPRHLVVKDGVALVACELDNTVRAIDIDTGEELAQVPPSLSDDSVPSAITITEAGHVLVGNRGPDTIGVLEWNGETKKLVYLNEFDCGGKHPRDFALTADQEYLVVANLHSDNVAILRLDAQSVTMEVVGSLETCSPTCAIPVR